MENNGSGIDGDEAAAPSSLELLLSLPLLFEPTLD
jgi:hypothetical protein